MNYETVVSAINYMTVALYIFSIVSPDEPPPRRPKRVRVVK